MALFLLATALAVDLTAAIGLRGTHLLFTNHAVDDVVQNIVTGQITFGGLSLADAQDNQDAFRAGIASVLDEVAEDDITSLTFQELETASRRQLTDAGVTATYEIEVESEDAAAVRARVRRP